MKFPLHRGGAARTVLLKSEKMTIVFWRVLLYNLYIPEKEASFMEDWTMTVEEFEVAGCAINGD